jgi:predicted transcriptional regulator of viral defense system
VQAGLFKLVLRGCCIVPAAARREGVYHSVHGFFDCALTVDVYNICHDAQLAGLGLKNLSPSSVLALPGRSLPSASTL